MNRNGEERCQGYLELLEIYLRRGLQIRSFIRMCVSNWYAFHCGDKALLNTRGTPHWLNRLDPRKRQERAALLSISWISPEAMEVIERPELFNKNDPARSVIVDHSVPFSVVERKLRELDDPTTAAIEAVLRRHYAVGVITYAQNQDLNRAKLTSCMPDDWDEVDPYWRYRKVGIRNVKDSCVP
jgi:hypothetical protein